MLRPILAFVVFALSITLLGCNNATSGLQSYTNALEGYEFVYPNGWQEIEVEDNNAGVDVVFRDIVERSENVSVVINEVGEGKKLTDLGTPSDVGQRLKQTIAPPNSDRQAQLLRAEQSQKDGKTYYQLEYQVTFPNNQQRHDLASVAVSRGKLFTLNVSTPQHRWDSLSERFKAIANSFEVY